MRWSAIEVLKENKFSKASDVWSFGVLMFEVMSRGAQPYSEFANLAEVTEQIKNGYTMSCPNGCEAVVHEKAMLPCWNSDPSKRPGFAALMETLVDLGAVPLDAADATKPATLSFAPRVTSDARTADTSVSSTGSRISTTTRELLGPSVHHVQNVLAPSVFEAVLPPWKEKKGNAVNPPEAATITIAVQAVVKPVSAEKVCPRDGIIGAAYVDTLVSQDDVGLANALLSCKS